MMHKKFENRKFHRKSNILIILNKEAKIKGGTKKIKQYISFFM